MRSDFCIVVIPSPERELQPVAADGKSIAVTRNRETDTTRKLITNRNEGPNYSSISMSLEKMRVSAFPCDSSRMPSSGI
jgi:hypothetical protein